MSGPLPSASATDRRLGLLPTRSRLSPNIRPRIQECAREPSLSVATLRRSHQAVRELPIDHDLDYSTAMAVDYLADIERLIEADLESVRAVRSVAALRSDRDPHLG
jgi:hypothetical protein